MRRHHLHTTLIVPLVVLGYLLLAPPAPLTARAASSSSASEATCEADGTCTTSASPSSSNCADSQDECPQWAARGECDVNPVYMDRNCALSCGKCGGGGAAAAAASEEEGGRKKGHDADAAADVKSERRSPPPCEDGNEECAKWAGAGECDKNPVYMHRTCAYSCGKCGGDGGDGEEGGEEKEEGTSDSKEKEECKNKHPKCDEWAEQGECESNPEYMRKNCPVSCRSCPGQCTDLRPDDCPGWAEQGECESNPGFMNRNCPLSCRICAPSGGDACEDVGEGCEEEARGGMCVIDPDRMKRVCRESCYFCVDEKKARERGESEELISKKVAYMSLNLGKKQVISGTKEEREMTKESLISTDVYAKEVLSSADVDAGALRECRNHAKYCAYWAGQGRCDDQREFMMKQCPLSCRACLK